MLLSADGTRVAVGQYVTETPDVAVQDLVSGAVRRVEVGEGSGVIPLAWAPDGSSLVALVSAAPLLPYVGLRGPDLAGRPVLVDVEAGAVRPLDLPGAPSVVRAAAFSPDGRHLALQPSPREVVLVDLEGGPPRSLDAPDGLLAGSAAWSPDGRLLAVDAARCTELLPVDGSEASTCLTEAGQGHHRFVGWAGARSAVVLVGMLPDGSETDPAPLVAVDLDTRERSTLSGVRTAGADYAVSRLQVPAAALSGALLSGNDAREDPAPTAERGPWPRWVSVLAAVLVAALVGRVTGATAARLRRRRQWRRAVTPRT